MGRLEGARIKSVRLRSRRAGTGSTDDASGRGNEDRPAVRKEQRGLGLTLLALTFAMSISFLDRSLLNLLVAPIREEFELSDLQFSALQGMSFAVVYSFAALPMAALADRRSRYGVIIGSIAAWSVMTVLFGLSGSFFALAVTRAGVALGEAGLGPAGISLLRDICPPEHRSTAVAVFSSGAYLGSGLALIIGGPLHDFLADPENRLVLGTAMAPWRLLFVAAGSLGILAILLCLRIPDPRRGDSRPSDTNSWKAFSIALKLRRKEATVYLVALSGFLSIASAVPAWVPSMLMRSYNWSPGQVGISFGALYCLAGLAGTTIGGIWADRLTRRGVTQAPARVIRSASLVAMAAGTAVAGAPTPFWSLCFSGILMMALGAGLALAALGFQNLLPARFSARAVAFYLLTAGTASLSLGPTLVPWFAALMNSGEDLRQAFAAVSILFGMWSALFLSLLLLSNPHEVAKPTKLD